jgi:hypothetical protein
MGVGEALSHGLRLPERGLQVVFHVDDCAGNAHAAVAEVRDRAQHHERIGVHVHVDTPLFRLLRQPTGIAQPVVGQVVRLARDMMVRRVLRELVRRADAGLSETDLDLLDDFFT